MEPCGWRKGHANDAVQLSVDDPGFAVLVCDDDGAGHRLPECSGHILADANLAGAIVRIREGMWPRGQDVRTDPAVTAIDLDVQKVALAVAVESYDRVENTPNDRTCSRVRGSRGTVIAGGSNKLRVRGDVWST